MKPIRDPEPMALFGARIRMLRQQQGLTQQAVADQLQIDRTTYTKYEAGRVSPDQQGLVHLAVLFGVSVDSLLGHRESTVQTALNSSDQPITVLSNEEKHMLQMFRQLPSSERVELVESVQKSLREKTEKKHE